MKIERNKPKFNCKLSELKIGFTFICDSKFDDDLYIKTNCVHGVNNIACVNLRTGISYLFRKDDIIHPITAYVTIDGKE